MSLLLISDSYHPDHRSSALIVRSIYDHFSNLNYKTHVLSLIESTPKIFSENITFIKTKSFRNKNFVIRAILTSYYILKMSVKLLFLKLNPSLVYIYYPSFFLLFLVPLINFKYKKCKILIHYQDHFPENAYDLKIIKNKLIYNLIRKFRDKIIFNEKMHIVVNSHNQKKYLSNKQKIKNIFFFHNWAISKSIKINKKKKYSKFTFIYAGNIGPAQNLSVVLNVLSNNDFNINLKIYGSGRGYIDLKQKFKKFKNFEFNNFVDNSKLCNIYNKCHAALISLSANHNTNFIPSKFYDYCFQRIPIFSINHRNCELTSMINRNQIGIATSNYESTDLHSKLKLFINNYENYLNNGKFNIYDNNFKIFSNFLFRFLNNN